MNYRIAFRWANYLTAIMVYGTAAGVAQTQSLPAAPVVAARDVEGEIPAGHGGADPAAEFAPRQSPLPVPPPPDAIVLFAGTDRHLFRSTAGGDLDWPVDRGALVSTANGRRSHHAVSQVLYRDAEIHLEFWLPPGGDGNSGVYLQGLYELQILDSSGRGSPDAGDLGAVYGLYPPRVNASRPPGAWQVYDIQYRAPRRNAQGLVVEPGTITAWLNGRLIQDRVQVGEATSQYNPYRYDTTPYLQQLYARQLTTNTGPIILQDHDTPVRFRNIWLRPLDDKSVSYAEPDDASSSSR